MSSGLTKTDERALRSALDRLHACNRKPYLGGNEQYAVDLAILGIKQRLEPTPVHQLLAAAEKVCQPLEHLFRDLDAQEAVAECCG
jgi:hypothetical protein